MQCVLFGRSRRTNFCPPPPPPKLLGPSPWLGRRTLSAAHLRICPLPSITFFWAYLREDYTDAFPDWAIAEITLVILHPRGLFAALFIPYTFTVVAQNGRHTIPNSKRKPKSERWSPETPTTPMPKPTGCNTQYSPACAHISYFEPYYTSRSVLFTVLRLLISIMFAKFIVHCAEEIGADIPGSRVAGVPGTSPVTGSPKGEGSPALALALTPQAPPIGGSLRSSNHHHISQAP